MKKTFLVLWMSVALLTIFTSCTGLFTTSLGSKLARDPAKKYSKASTGDLVNLIKGNTLNSSDAKGVINALSGKPDSELKNLSATETGAVLNAAGTAIVPMDALTSAAGEFLNGGSNLDPKALFNTLISGINTNIDTNVLTVLLGNADSVNGVSKDNSTSLLLAAVGLLGSEMKKNEVTYETLVGSGSGSGFNWTSQTDIKSSLSSCLPGTSDANLDAVSKVFAAMVGAPSTGYDSITPTLMGQTIDLKSWFS